MKNSNWKWKLACLSWVHPRFCAHQYLEVSRALEGMDDWEQIKNELVDLKFFSKPPNFEKAEALFNRYLIESSTIRYVCPLDSEYPAILLQSSRPPALLSYMGQPIWTRYQGLAIVGSRKLHPVTEHWAQMHIPQWLKAEKLCVISGGATGVDQMAHRMALRQQVPTMVVLPSGIDNPSPSSLSNLLPLVISQGGVVISQFAPNASSLPAHFHLRNRLLVSLSQGLLVLQAARRSGSYLSARMALDEGRAVGVVPGHPTESQFSGNLDLIFDGAQMIRDRQDLEFMLSETSGNRLYI